jgi:hypothetical protein
MSIESISDRFAKLRAMRDKLCSKEKNWNDAFQARDWVVEQMQCLKTLIQKDESTKDDILNRIEDLLCVLEPAQTGDDDA